MEENLPVGHWTDKAACRGMDPKLFFPGRGESSEEARAACAKCPVVADCLSHALKTRQGYGVWGGLSERKRRTIRRWRECAKCGKAFRLVPNEPGAGRERSLCDYCQKPGKWHKV